MCRIVLRNRGVPGILVVQRRRGPLSCRILAADARAGFVVQDGSSMWRWLVCAMPAQHPDHSGNEEKQYNCPCYDTPDGSRTDTYIEKNE